MFLDVLDAMFLDKRVFEVIYQDVFGSIFLFSIFSSLDQIWVLKSVLH